MPSEGEVTHARDGGQTKAQTEKVKATNGSTDLVMTTPGYQMQNMKWEL